MPLFDSSAFAHIPGQLAMATDPNSERITTMTDQTAEQSLTHHVALILDNEETFYLQRREIVQAAMNEAVTRFQGRPKVAIRIAAENLKDWAGQIVEDETGDLAFGLARELLTTALAFVDWDALAESWIEEERES